MALFHLLLVIKEFLKFTNFCGLAPELSLYDVGEFFGPFSDFIRFRLFYDFVEGKCYLLKLTTSLYYLYLDFYIFIILQIIERTNGISGNPSQLKNKITFPLFHNFLSFLHLLYHIIPMDLILTPRFIQLVHFFHKLLMKTLQITI